MKSNKEQREALINYLEQLSTIQREGGMLTAPL